jgi:hypothetical protein
MRHENGKLTVIHYLNHTIILKQLSACLPAQVIAPVAPFRSGHWRFDTIGDIIERQVRGGPEGSVRAAVDHRVYKQQAAAAPRPDRQPVDAGPVPRPRRAHAGTGQAVPVHRNDLQLPVLQVFVYKTLDWPAPRRPLDNCRHTASARCGDSRIIAEQLPEHYSEYVK